ncbi:MAG TPA: DoxX family protein [Myxococcota bacterium]|nr:DoxX family protein [Myxococcota bacterium]
MRRGEVPGSVVLIRAMVGAIFVSEGLQKFLYPDLLGVGRFAQIGIPVPGVMAPFVGSTELGCGLLVLLGLFTRAAVVPLLGVMAVAIATTKIPILLKSGFWSMAHEARTDYAMVLGALFLLLVGSGPWSLDAWLFARRTKHGA